MTLKSTLVSSLLLFPVIDPSPLAQDGWILQQTDANVTLSSVSFLLNAGGSTSGWAVGENGTIIHTMNEGQDWIIQQSGKPVELHSVSFAYPALGWAVGNLGSVYHANQFGTAWTQESSLTSGTLWSVHFIDLDNGWIAGDSGVVIQTQNGGGSWTIQNSGTTARLNDVHFSSPSEGWTVGEGGGIYSTSDGGDTWTSQPGGVDADLHSVFFADPTTGWIVGRGHNGGETGVILHTTDSGNSWNEQDNPVSGLSWLADVFFADPNNGWAVGGFGKPGIIIHTTDGGLHWTQQMSPTDDWFNGVTFVNADVGWIVGSNGTALHTTTGGTGLQPPPPTVLVSPPHFSVVSTSPTLNWDPASGSFWYNLQVSRSSYFVTHVLNRAGIDTNSFQLDSLEGAARYYWRVSVTDANGTSGWSEHWIFTTEGDLPEPVTLVSPAHGTVAPVDSLVLSWNRGSPNIDFYGIDIANDSLFEDGIVYIETRDTSYSVEQIYQIETYWWRVRARNPVGQGPFSEGRKYSILPTDVKSEDQLPVRFGLHQNYPNPFNPTTTFEFSIPTSLFANLSIYNLLGEKVATVVNGNLNAGTHTVQWDATGQPSGVYFYRLLTNDFVQTRKLVLLR